MAFPLFVAFISWPKQTSYDGRNANVLVAAMLLCGAAFQPAAPISSALFESRKCPILGMGLFGKIAFLRRRPPAPNQAALPRPIRLFFALLLWYLHPLEYRNGD
jgi:hypothetical protein